LKKRCKSGAAAAFDFLWPLRRQHKTCGWIGYSATYHVTYRIPQTFY